MWSCDYEYIKIPKLKSVETWIGAPRKPVTIAKIPVRISSLVSLANLLKTKIEVSVKKYWHYSPAQDKNHTQNGFRKGNKQYSGNTFFNPSGTICHGNNVPYFYGADVHGQSVRLVPLGSNRKTCSCQRKTEEGINFLLLLLNQWHLH